MIRRVHTTKLIVGEIALDAGESRHLRDALRLETGTEIEVFDDAGNVARGTIRQLSPEVVVEIRAIDASAEDGFELTVAAAVPKGERADWMVEKLSELGCAAFIPLASERSVVLPEGKNKRERWMRIATESAKQCRRRGVMRIAELAKLDAVLKSGGKIISLSTENSARPIASVLSVLSSKSLTLLIGPEGGWSDAEMTKFAASTVVGVKLTDTILRVETAAIAAAAVVMTLRASNRGGGS